MSFTHRYARSGRVLEPSLPPRFTSAALARLPGVRHGFFGREGGVSAGVYATLNAGQGSRDDAASVAENRRRIAAGIGVAPERLVGVHQVHSAIVHRVAAPWPDARPEGDALVTTEPDLALSVLTADCAPVLLADSQARVIGAAHAGWRGALGGVLEATVAAMAAAGAASTRITAAIGPCIRQPSYEVGPEFRAAFLEGDAASAPYFRPGAGDRLLFDLPGYCNHRLRRAGVERVDALALDTYSDPTAMFSHRRSVHQGHSDYGRNCAVIALEP
ncbi:MAG: peptidoglycan editing factor PgeF [Hyphomonadaceae bacterium]|nr:peptidoglycan editing factor PgeF [Hyphomonadaceae bacterium]